MVAGYKKCSLRNGARMQAKDFGICTRACKSKASKQVCNGRALYENITQVKEKEHWGTYCLNPYHSGGSVVPKHMHRLRTLHTASGMQSQQVPPSCNPHASFLLPLPPKQSHHFIFHLLSYHFPVPSFHNSPPGFHTPLTSTSHSSPTIFISTNPHITNTPPSQHFTISHPPSSLPPTSSLAACVWSLAACASHPLPSHASSQPKSAPPLCLCV